jgi:hypothetical protein
MTELILIGILLAELIIAIPVIQWLRRPPKFSQKEIDKIIQMYEQCKFKKLTLKDLGIDKIEMYGYTWYVTEFPEWDNDKK